MGRTRELIWWLVSLERLVAPLLQVAGVCVWRPAQERYVLFDGLWVPEPLDLLPGYALLGSELPWYEIQRATGAELLRSPGARVPRPVDAGLLARLEAAELGGEVLWQVPAYTPGQRVLVREDVKSSYAGLSGRFIQAVPVRCGWFAEVDLEVVGGVMLPIDHLEPVDGVRA